METTLGEIMRKRVQRLKNLDKFRKKETKKMSKLYYLEVKTLCDDGIAEIEEEKEFWTNLQNKLKHVNSLFSEESKEKFGYKDLETKYDEIFNNLEIELKGYKDLLQTLQKHAKETQQMLLGLEPADRFILQVDPESMVDLNILEVRIGDQ